MRFYIADCHFYHEALNTKMDNRGFANAQEMNSYMIERWNKKVRKCDEVVILGDFSYGDAMQTNTLLNELKGKKYLIQGNHDTYLKYRRFDQSLFEWIRPYEELHDEGRKVILSHYPVMCYNGQYRIDVEGMPKTYMLYGHVHDTRDERLINQFIRITRETSFIDFSENEKKIPCYMINCFCKFSDYAPMTLDEWIEIDEKRRKKLDELKISDDMIKVAQKQEDINGDI